MPATTRRHSSSPSASTPDAGDALPIHTHTHSHAHLPRPMAASTYALSSMYPPDKNGVPSSSPTGLLPSSMPLSSPQRFAYRDTAQSDTESESGASEDEIDASFAAFTDSLSTEEHFTLKNKGKGKAVDVRERGLRRHLSAKAKQQAALGLGRRPRSRNTSRSRVVSTESMYMVTHNMSTLKTSPLQPDDENDLSSVLNSKRRGSSPSPVPSSPEPSDVDTPVPRTRKLAMSRLALAKSNKRRAEAVRVAATSSARRASNKAWGAHEDISDRDTLERLAAQQGLKLVPITPPSRNKGLSASGATTRNPAATGAVGPNHKRVRSPPTELQQPSTPTAIEGLLSPKRKHVRVRTPASPTRGPSAAGPPQSSFSPALNLTAAAQTREGAPFNAPRAIDLVEDIVLDTASEDDIVLDTASEDDILLDTASEDDNLETDHEPNPVRPKRNRVERPVRLATKPTKGKSATRARYERDHPGADHARHAAEGRRARVHQVGVDCQRTSDAPPPRHHWRIYLARRPVALRFARRVIFSTRKRSDREQPRPKETRPHKSRQIDERVRRGLLQRFNQRTMSALAFPPPVIPVTTTHKRRASTSSDPDDVAVDELLEDADMFDSVDSVEPDAVDFALAVPAQLAGRKRPSLPMDGSVGRMRGLQRSILRANELGWYAKEYRKHASWVLECRDPATASERRSKRAISHVAASELIMAKRRAAEAARREEEAEGWVDDSLIADADVDAVDDIGVDPVAVAVDSTDGSGFTTPMDATPEPEDSFAAPDYSVAEAIPVELSIDANSAAHGAPVAEPTFVVQGSELLQTSSEMVEDILSFERPPSPVQVVEEMSRPPAPRLRRRRVQVEDPATETVRDRPTILRRLRTVPGAPEAGFTGQRDESMVLDSTVPSNPSILAQVTRSSPLRSDTTFNVRQVAPPISDSQPAADSSTAGPSMLTEVGLRSPPPRYEFDFFPIIRSAVRAAPAPAPRRTRARAASDPPDYTGPYRSPLSPQPPPPYNALTDRDTVIAPVFDREQAPPSPWPARQPLALTPDAESEDERHAPGNWPARRRRSSSPVMDVVMEEAQPQRGGGISMFRRWLGL